MDLWTLFGDIVVLLAACLLLGGLFSRIGHSPLVGYLFAGMVMGGPGSLHAIGSESEIEAIAELGVALLLFSLGLDFSWQRFRKLGNKPLLGGVVQVVSTMLLAAWGAFLFGLSPTESIAFGAMVSLSSTAVVLRMLMERSELDMPHGRNSLAVLLTQDMAVVPLALLMTLLASGGDASSAAIDIARTVLMAFALIAGLFLLNKLAVLALGRLTLVRNRELTVIFAVVTGLGSAWAAQFAGISPALGAFVAGMLLGSSPFATQIRADISSLRVVLLTLFFGAVGMVADPIWIIKNWYVVAMAVVLLTIGKFAVIWAIFQALGQTARVASATGLCLAQIGEFAFVLGSIGRANEVVSQEIYALVVSVAMASFFLSAFLVPHAPQFGHRIATWFGGHPTDGDDQPTPVPPPDVIIIGFGTAGQLAAQPFIDSTKQVVIIDLNHEQVRRAKQCGFRGEIGDATQYEVLEHARLAEAKVVVITIPHHRSAMTVLDNIRQQMPEIRVAVRSRYQIHTDDFLAAGAHVVVGDEERVGEGLALHLQKWLDTRGGEADEEEADEEDVGDETKPD